MTDVTLFGCLFIILCVVSAILSFTYWLSVRVRPNKYLISLAMFFSSVTLFFISLNDHMLTSVKDNILFHSTIFIFMIITGSWLIYNSWKSEVKQK